MKRNEEGWLVFSFTVRGVTILGCRWRPQRGSIQLPVSFFLEDSGDRFRHVKKPVVCAYGAHIIRLRKALEAELQMQEVLLSRRNWRLSLTESPNVGLRVSETISQAESVAWTRGCTPSSSGHFWFDQIRRALNTPIVGLARCRFSYLRLKLRKINSG
jgi:hypothetical protein